MLITGFAECATAKASDTDVAQAVADAEEIVEKYTIQVKDVIVAVTKTVPNKGRLHLPFKPYVRSSPTRGANLLQIGYKPVTNLLQIGYKLVINLLQICYKLYRAKLERRVHKREALSLKGLKKMILLNKHCCLY